MPLQLEEETHTYWPNLIPMEIENKGEWAVRIWLVEQTIGNLIDKYFDIEISRDEQWNYLVKYTPKEEDNK